MIAKRERLLVQSSNNRVQLAVAGVGKVLDFLLGRPVAQRLTLLKSATRIC
jgi:hypothetical protein